MFLVIMSIWLLLFLILVVWIFWSNLILFFFMYCLVRAVMEGFVWGRKVFKVFRIVILFLSLLYRLVNLRLIFLLLRILRFLGNLFKFWIFVELKMFLFVVSLGIGKMFEIVLVLMMIVLVVSFFFLLLVWILMILFERKWVFVLKILMFVLVIVV